MAKITLVSTGQAKPGNKFIFQKVLEDCSDCKLKQVCSDNLQEGRVYKILNVRNKKHNCYLFNLEMSVVEVKLAELEALIDKKIAYEGATITFKHLEAKDLPESLHDFLNPPGLRTGDKCKILKVLDLKEASKTPYRVAQLELVLNNDLG